MPSCPLSVRLLALCLGGAALPAAELVLREVSLGIVSWPADFDYTLDSSVIDDSGSDAFEAAGGIDLGLRWSFAQPGSAVGVLAGGDLLFMGMPYGSDDGLVMAALRVGGGGAWAISDGWTLSAEAGLGYGLSTMRFPASSASGSSTVDGTSLFYDAQVRLTWNAGRDWSLAAMAGWVMAEHDLSGGGSDLSLEQDGLMFGLSVSWRISDLPAGLE